LRGVSSCELYGSSAGLLPWRCRARVVLQLGLEPARFGVGLNHPQRPTDLISVFYECQLLRRTVGVSASRCRRINSSNPTIHGSWPGWREGRLHASDGLCRDRPLTVIIPSGCAAPAVVTYTTSPPRSHCVYAATLFCTCHARQSGCGYAWQLRASQDVAAPDLFPVCPAGTELTAVESVSSSRICQQPVTGKLRVFRLSRSRSRRFLTRADL
jgi:hypothetical protein